jgi:predicted nucleic acid-binding protein
MDSDKVFIDSDILLDLFFDRMPHSQYAVKLFDVDLKQKFDLYTSALVTANLYYIISKQRNKKYANECLAKLLRHVHILPLEVDALEYGLTGISEDFEDAIQFHIAKKKQCTKLLSRNIRDYKHSSIPVLTAQHFLKR